MREHGFGATTRAARLHLHQRQVRRRLADGPATVEVGEGVRFLGDLVVSGPGQVVIGDHCVFRPGRATTIEVLSPDAVVELGDHCSVNGAALTATEEIRVGPWSLLARSWFVDTDFHSIQRDRRRPGVTAAGAPIELGRNVWVATGAYIYKGVTIGDHSVVGAGSHVRRDVPADVVVIGNPAVVVSHLDPEVPGPPW
jgi:bifunctional N-acetylglucosamine-1-phosphate-uridyltransferase/glucosamine-1-phosphate-acetyltransferase GlmU-like protein